MRPNNNNNNNNNRRGRSRGPRKPHGGPHTGISNKGQGYDGNAADVRVRGNAYQVLEKYLQLARDAGTVGDRVAAENFLQHADHYYRVVAAMQEGQRPRIGGRDVSVAEVNVQNGSQGLSTALYSGHSQPGAQAGNAGGDGNGGDKAPQGNGQDGGHQVGGHQAGSHQAGGHQSGHSQAAHHQAGQHQGGGNQNAAGQGGSHQAGERSGGQTGFTDAGSNASPAPSGYAPAKPMDEQPEYPAELIPGAAPQSAAGDGGVGDPSGQDQDRGGRGQARGRGRRPVRRPRQDGESGPNSGDSGE